MKKTNKKKGFTIVELVIVIAVIAILAAVLIPTFSNVIENANKSAALQAARNALTEWKADSVDNATSNANLLIVSGDYVVLVTNNQIASDDVEKATATASSTKYFEKATGTYNANTTYYTISGENTSKSATNVTSGSQDNFSTYYVESSALTYSSIDYVLEGEFEGC